MHLRKDIDIMKFLEEAKKCSSDVTYKTPEGDILNLSSTLSQFVFCTIATQPNCWGGGTIHCSNNADYLLLKDYLIDDDIPFTANQ